MFTYHDTESAPEESKPLLEQSQKNMGMVPNLHRVLTGPASKLISYFANALAHTEPDEPLQKYAWTHPTER